MCYMLGIYFIHLFIYYLFILDYSIQQMYILVKRNETGPSHNVILMKVKSMRNCIDHDKRSETR